MKGWHIGILMHPSLLCYWSGITESSHSHPSCGFLSLSYPIISGL